MFTTRSLLALQASSFPSIVHLIWPLCALIGVAAILYFVIHRTRAHGESWNHALRVHDSLRQLQASLREHGAGGSASSAAPQLESALLEAKLTRSSAQKLGRRRYRKWSRALSSVGECQAACMQLNQQRTGEAPGLDDARLRQLEGHAHEHMEHLITDLRQFMGGASDDRTRRGQRAPTAM